jgi:GT2 family glycosyltransferase
MMIKAKTSTGDSMELKVYVVIVTYNGMKWIEKCFSSLRTSNCLVHVIAVDNGSTDGTQEAIRQRFPEVQLIQNAKNIGFGKANNIGMRMAIEHNARFVFLLNQDAWLREGSLSQLVDTMRHHPDIGLLSPLHLNGIGTGLDKKFAEYISELGPNLTSDIALNENIDQIYDVKFVNAAAWLLSRACVERVGYFDDMFFMYGEDDNYFQRIGFHQFRTAILPKAAIFHDRPIPVRIKINTSAWKARRRNRLLVGCLDINKPLGSSIRRVIVSEIDDILKGLVTLKWPRTRSGLSNLAFLVGNYKLLRKKRASY